MPKLNEHRIVKRRNGLFSFNYEAGIIKPFQRYYLVEEWCKRGSYYNWYPCCITNKTAYERFKETGECIYECYGNRL